MTLTFTTKETNCPKAIGSLPQKFKSVQYKVSCEYGQEIAHISYFVEMECTYSDTSANE